MNPRLGTRWRRLARERRRPVSKGALFKTIQGLRPQERPQWPMRCEGRHELTFAQPDLRATCWHRFYNGDRYNLVGAVRFSLLPTQAIISAQQWAHACHVDVTAQRQQHSCAAFESNVGTVQPNKLHSIWVKRGCEHSVGLHRGPLCRRSIRHCSRKRTHSYNVALDFIILHAITSIGTLANTLLDTRLVRVASS